MQPAVLTGLLVIESWLGGLIRGQGEDTLTAVHVPLDDGAAYPRESAPAKVYEDATEVV